MIEYIFMVYFSLFSVAIARQIKMKRDPLFFLESYESSIRAAFKRCVEVREKKITESTLDYIRSLSSTEKHFVQILKCHL